LENGILVVTPVVKVSGVPTDVCTDETEGDIARGVEPCFGLVNTTPATTPAMITMTTTAITIPIVLLLVFLGVVGELLGLEFSVNSSPKNVYGKTWLKHC
jgi:hypothetical protein